MAQSKSPSGLQFDVKEVSVLPHVGARFKTMKLIPAGDYENWRMDAGSVVSQQVVSVPKQPDSMWIETLVLVRNNGGNDEKLDFKNPQLQLASGGSIKPWEHLFAGMADYQGLVGVLGLSDKAPGPDANAVHLNVEGTLYCNLKSKQQTWIIMVFQVPKSAKDGKLSISNYPPTALKIPSAR
jgi:hypothetical protein